MSKGLEALQFMRERDMFLPSCASTIEKELKVLEFIKQNIVMIRAFNDSTKRPSYHTLIEIKGLIPNEECDLLKEVLL